MSNGRVQATPQQPGARRNEFRISRGDSQLPGKIASPRRPSHACPYPYLQGQDDLSDRVSRFPLEPSRCAYAMDSGLALQVKS